MQKLQKGQQVSYYVTPGNYSTGYIIAILDPNIEGGTSYLVADEPNDATGYFVSDYQIEQP